MENNLRNNVDYLRLSLTDRCNLNCIYCTPIKKAQLLFRDEVLSYEEIVRAAGLFVKAGIKKIRLTGGEPLIKRDIIELIKALRRIDGLEEMTITTNGVNLKAMAGGIKEAGLDRINVSLDTLRKERFRQITGFDYFEDVWAGIKESIRVGLHPLKLNVILLKGINNDEVLNFVRLTLKHSLFVRFIEFFPTNKRSKELSHCAIKNEAVKEEIEGYFGKIDKTNGIKGNGPAEYYKIKGSAGAVGFISNASSDFCGGCNRIRMDCAGKVSPCLFSGNIYDLKSLLRNGTSENEIKEYIKYILKEKPLYNKKRLAYKQGIEMSNIGG